MSLFRKRVVYFPSGESLNPYVLSMKAAIAGLGCNVITPNQWLKSINPFKKDILFLNWIEDGFISKSGDVDYLRYLSSLLFFICASFFCKIVWIKHNHRPHVEPAFVGRVMRGAFVFLLRHLSQERAVHSQSFAEKEGFSFIPHPVNAVSVRPPKSFKYLGVVVGSILPYKKHIEILRDWPADRSLAIIGPAPDKKYLDEVCSLIESKGLQVTVFAERVSEEFLQSVVNQSACIVAKANSDASIVSGATYYGMSFGKPLLFHGCRSRFEDFDHLLYPGIFQYASENEVLAHELELTCLNSVVLAEFAEKNFGYSIVKETIWKLIE